MSDFISENPQLRVERLWGSCWTCKCRWHDAFPARKRLSAKSGLRDVHLYQSSLLISFLRVSFFVSFSLKQDEHRMFVLMHEYSTVMSMRNFSSWRETSWPSHVLRKESYFSKTVWLVRIDFFTATMSTDHNKLRKAENKTALFLVFSITLISLCRTIAFQSPEDRETVLSLFVSLPAVKLH